jgi:hypothetical protein
MLIAKLTPTKRRLWAVLVLAALLGGELLLALHNTRPWREPPHPHALTDWLRALCADVPPRDPAVCGGPGAMPNAFCYDIDFCARAKALAADLPAGH